MNDPEIDGFENVTIHQSPFDILISWILLDMQKSSCVYKNYIFLLRISNSVVKYLS